MKKRNIILVLICFVLTGFLAACDGAETLPPPTESPTEVPAVTPTQVPERLGAHLDNIYMFQTIPDQAAQQVLDGALDIYAGGLRADQLAALDENSLPYEISVKRQYELLINPVSTKELTGIENPLFFSKVRRALNLLFDRQYITEEIFSGGAVAKYQPLIYQSGDYVKNAAAIAALAEEFTYDFDTAEQIITQTLGENGFEKSDEGVWSYKNNPVNIIILIRNDDGLRTGIGEYAAEQLEKLGFSVTRRYVSLSEANTLWAAGNPGEGQWHIYTGRRTLDTVTLDQSSVFADYYTGLGEFGDINLYKHFTPDEDFVQKASALIDGEYVSLEQKQEMMSDLISVCNEYSYRIWLVDEFAYYPHTEKTEFAGALSTRPDIDFATVYTFKKTGVWGGTAAWGSDSLLKGIVNPVNGSTGPSETQYLNFTTVPLIYGDSGTGEKKPIFIEGVSITYHSDISYVNDAKWITSGFSDEIAVPNDAVISWDPKDDSAIYADADYMHDAVGLATAWLATYEREKPKDPDKIARQQEIIEGLQAIENRGYLTCNVKYVVEYDDSIYGLEWHDGSGFSVADIIMAFITKTQLINEDSLLYDEYYAQAHEGELDGFKGFKIVSEKPLIIEYYTDDYSHLASETIKPLWVDYGTGQQSWAQAAAANEAVKSRTATYSQGISAYYGYSLLDYVKGQDGLDALLEAAERLKHTAYIPYEELLVQYIQPESAAAHYRKITDFYAKYKHLHIGLGPYMITSVDALTPSLALAAYPDFPIEADEMAEKFK